jgi:GlcNAc-P-P-Und epimerase
MKVNKNCVLITGGSGFIGSYFNKSLTGKVINYDLREPIHPNNNIYEEGDIRDKERLREVVEKYKPTQIIHLAAAHHDFGISREEYFSVNEKGLEVICDVATESNIKEITYYSSVAVYGESSTPSTESSETIPSNDYGDSKLAGEVVLKNWVEEDPNRKALIIRPVLVYGARNTANMFNLIRQIDSGLYANIGDGKNIKSICFVENIVAATNWALSTFDRGTRIYNYADEPHLTAGDAVEIIRKSLDKRKPVRIPLWLGVVAAIPFDIFIKITRRNLPVSSARVKKLNTATQHLAEKIRKEGFMAKYDNIQGLELMVDWYKKKFRNSN